MAATSSSFSDENSKAPDKFHIGNDSDGSHWSASPIKCPLCILSKKYFHCRDCIRAGDFLHSTDCLTERYADKQLKYFHFKSVHRSLEARCNQLLQKKRNTEDLKYNIKRKKENVAILYRLLEEKRASLISTTTQRDAIVKINRDAKKKLPQYEKNVNNLREFVEKRLENNENSHKSCMKLKHQLKYRIRHNLQMLIKYIFPIWQTVSKSVTDIIGTDEVQHFATNTTTAAIIPDTVSGALAEATHMAYVRGRWVLQDSQNELQHVIVAPSLPNNGDYSSYNDWVATTKDGVPSSTGTNDSLSSSNSAYRISAALTYTTQLVDLLSFYLDVRLPYKILYSDFCKKELSEQSFTRKVARLNANILYLCYTQRVKLSHLNPSHTLQNIQQLLNTEISDLGRIGAVDLTDGFRDTNDSQLVQDLNNGSDSESEDENSFPNEWEAIPHLSLLDMNTSPPLGLMNQQQHQQASSSIAGGLVNNAMASVTSIWRVWAKR